MTKIKINWLNESPGATADERGYWRSTEGRFHISPNYRHTIHPDSYSLLDMLKNREGRRPTYDTVREAKAAALNTVTDEVANEIGL
jgi:hypothetical protein